ncbi:MAG: hypothetical protein AAF800_14510, partial [Planctomycetota bacterium]
WGQGAFGPDDRFYFAVGNHRTDDRADAWLVAYEPADRSMQHVMSTRDTAGWGDDARAMGDGKLHTAIDWSGDGVTYLTSFYGNYPTRNDWATRGGAYPGGRLFRHDLRKNTSRLVAIPSPRDSWAVQRWDTRRGLLVAVGERGPYRHPDLGQDQARGRLDRPGCGRPTRLWTRRCARPRGGGHPAGNW